MGLHFLNLDSFGDTFKERCSVFNYKVQMATPEICLGLGIASLIGAVVASAVAGKHIDEIAEDHTKRVEEAKSTAVMNADGTEVVNTKEVNRAVRNQYVVTGGKYAKNFALPAALTGASIFFQAKGYTTQASWVAGLSAALTSTQQMFKTYRENNIALKGEEHDLMCRYGYKETKEVDENGNVVVKRRPKTIKEAADELGYDPKDPRMFMILNKRNCSLLSGYAATDVIALQKAEEAIRRVVNTNGFCTRVKAFELLGLEAPEESINLIYGFVKGGEPARIGWDNAVNNRFLAGYNDEDIVLEFSGEVNLMEYFDLKNRATKVYADEYHKRRVIPSGV